MPKPTSLLAIAIEVLGATVWVLVPVSVLVTVASLNA